MDRSSVLTLISETQTQDDYGVWQSELTRREVFCQVNSVSRQEFFDAGRNGLNPEFELTMFAWDYHGERICELDGKTYAIYRTYLAKTDIIELYVSRKGGTNGVGEDQT